ncbi:hypothetical protein [Cellvibrio sp. PSBB006]|uniref:hypothetical protein n=1 Tax=Cellvibrio sp. PSBB006 TaxID=1987723 RepID=UPI0018DF7A99|nr:hypothetical protein [Cellvibrio sp. PSBB006]
MMGYKAQFDGWDSLTIEDLLVAYRKAKADFFENTFPSAFKFAEYEQKLITNLKKLLVRLQEQNGFEKDKAFLGDFRLLPKKLSTKRNTNHHQMVMFTSPIQNGLSIIYSKIIMWCPNSA